MIYFEASTSYLEMAELYGWYSDDLVISLLKNICVISDIRFDYNAISKIYKEYERFGDTSPIGEYGANFDGGVRYFTVEADKQYSMILLLREFTSKEGLD